MGTTDQPGIDQSGIDQPGIEWWSAAKTARAIAGGEVSSREVLEHLVARIERLDGPINSVVQWDLDRARAAAAAADDAVARGADLGPLHGVPMTIKDSFQTAGCVTTSGAPELADHVPAVDAAPVARLRQAGAIPFAKTNLPIYAGDIQSYNQVYGTTNNPYDLSRTPGGSSGGSAAALAMGFTALELGSDIGGSIRTPAHYSGVMGHKPSYGIVPAHGQIPGPPGTLSQADLAVAGPMARTSEDLALGLDVMVGPDRWDAPAWRLELRGPLVASCGELRVAAWFDDEACPVDADTARVLGDLATTLDRAGARVDVDARPAFTLAKAWDVFSTLLFAALSGGHPKDKIEHLAADTSDTPLGLVKRGTAARHRDWLSAHERRLQMRASFEEFFEHHDVLLLPVQPRPAIGHDHSPQWERVVEIAGQTRPYLDLFSWIAPAGLAYLPSTVVPVGMSRDGLPIGVQIVGPYLHDLTTIAVAGMIADAVEPIPRPDLTGER